MEMPRPKKRACIVSPDHEAVWAPPPGAPPLVLPFQRDPASIICAPEQMTAGLKCDCAPEQMKEELKCDFEFCPCRKSAKEFTVVREETLAGGDERDWSAVVGQTLCKSCWGYFARTGGLVRQPRAAPAGSQAWGKVGPCAFTFCPLRESASEFTVVMDCTRAGGAGRDWTRDVGKTFCKGCFECFARTGRMVRANGGKGEGGMQESWSNVGPCAYTLCPCPSANKFMVVMDGTRAGGAGRDWTAVAGQIFCRRCVDHFDRTGGLVRQSQAGSQRWSKVGPCAYTLCPHRESASGFTVVSEETCAGGAGRDWTGVVGQTFCKSCYEVFARTGGMVRHPRAAPVVAPSDSTQRATTRSSGR
ncbi:hypothetical protein T484DRAFT_1960154 [Baffinella frigidus]|nr:hypothetical protein T484DRAFT_1960154 [Cryptophyta sp. CCMP2293]